jgi:hypothetical protein
MVRRIVVFALLVMMLATTFATAQKARQPQMAKDHILMLNSDINTTGPKSAQANQLTFSFSDPVGDQSGTIDLTGMIMDFNNATGNYNIVLTTLSDVEIRLSTTTRSSDGLNFFCVNAGRNEKIVRRTRELTLRSSASGPVNGPKNFDIVIRMASFRYDPAEGNLLLEIRNTGTVSSGFQNTFLDASNVFGDPVSRVWQERGPFTSTKDTIGLVTKFFFAEPQ